MRAGNLGTCNSRYPSCPLGYGHYHPLLLFCIVNDYHGGVVTSLQLTYVGQERCDFAAGVLVDVIQTHERSKH